MADRRSSDFRLTQIGHPQLDPLGMGRNVQNPSKRRLALCHHELLGRFKDLSIRDTIRNDGLRPAHELAIELAPFLGQRPITPRIATLDPSVILKG